MKIEQAQRMLSDPKYAIDMIELTISTISRGHLEASGPPTVLQIAEMRGTVKGLRMAQGMFQDAASTIQAHEAAARITQEALDDVPPVPPAMIGAMLHPRKPDGDGN